MQKKTSPLNPLNLFGSVIHRHAEPHFHDLIEQLEEAFFLASPRSGMFLHVNYKAVELTSYSRAELNGLGLNDLFSNREAAEALDLIHHIEIGSNRQLQNVPLRTRSGKLAYTDLKLFGVESDGESSVMILARDALHRARSEQNLGRQRESLAALDEMVALLANPQPDSFENALNLCRQFLHAEMIGFYQARRESPGLYLTHTVGLPGEFPAQLDSADPAVNGFPLSWRTGERPTSAITRAARACGLSSLHTSPLNDDQAGLLIAGYRPPNFQPADITALTGMATRYLNTLQATQRQTERQAQLQTRVTGAEEKLRALLDETADGVAQIDIAGNIVALNFAAEELLGFQIAETFNCPLEDVLVSAQPLASSLLAALKQGQAWRGGETDLICRDGGAVAAWVRAVPLFDENNSLSGGLILISNRTDQRQFQEQSDHLERRAWLGDLSAIFAHDVRNPLNGIATGLSYMATKFESTDPLYEAVSKMQAEVTRIDQLLKDVLLVAKSSELKYRPVSLEQLLEKTLARWRPRLTRYNIELLFHANPETSPALADSNQMDQVFTNLIANAVEAMKNGGTLTIKCHPAADARAPRGDYVELLFSDTGDGIPSEMLQRIFDPFITTKADGTGLGLAITKRIITGHRGAIFAESWPGIGTAFHVFIPVVSGK
ncbi:MAG: PAS domain-containing protein [Chloroflexi bacterium]|nr:PAS domain-containing protein [Chloroflexota bacterium]